MFVDILFGALCDPDNGYAYAQSSAHSITSSTNSGAVHTRLRAAEQCTLDCEQHQLGNLTRPIYQACQILVYGKSRQATVRPASMGITLSAIEVPSVSIGRCSMDIGQSCDYRKSMEMLSKFYRNSIEILLKFYRNSFEILSKFYRNLNEILQQFH